LLANSKILLKILICLPVCLFICSTFFENADARDLGLMTLFLSEMHLSFAVAIYSLCGSTVVVVFVVVVICLCVWRLHLAVVVATSAVSKYIVHSISLFFPLSSLSLYPFAFFTFFLWEVVENYYYYLSLFFLSHFHLSYHY
jgi:hypothetical protein